MILDTKEIMKIKEVPIYNESGFIPSVAYSGTQPFSYISLIELIKKTPECIGILRAIQTDICSDGYSFEGPRVRVEKAEMFLKKNMFKNEFRAVIFDWLMLGNGALWRGKVSPQKVKEVIDKIQLTTGIEWKEMEVKALIDEDVYKTKLLKHAPWSTMNIDLTIDKTSVLQFRQMVSAEKVINFTPEEIIHGKFMDFDGKIYGFSPLQASVNILSTLSLIKDLNGNFFQNGGVPDWMFILPKEMANSENVRRLEIVLRKYKNARHKHGNLIFTGEVEAKELNRFDKDMEFRKLAIYYTGILALAFNMPLGRVSAIIGAEVKSGAADSDLSEAGYWRSISSAQDYWEDLLNTQLFEPEFGVTLRFNRGYMNDEIKEAQRDVQMFEVLNKLAIAGAITPEYIKYKLKIPERYWTGKFSPVEPSSPFGGNSGSPGSVNKEDLDGPAKQDNNERKKKQALDAQRR